MYIASTGSATTTCTTISFPIMDITGNKPRDVQFNIS